LLYVASENVEGRTHASYEGGLEFKSQTGQIYTALQTIRHRFNVYESSCVALVLWRGDRHRKLVTRSGIIRRVKWKVWFLVWRWKTFLN